MGEKEDGEEKDDAKEKDEKEEKDEKDEKKEKDDKKEDKKRSKDDDSSDSDKEDKKRKRTEGRGPPPDKRGRNIFGKMLGHLQQARTRLDAEKGSKANELRMKAQERTEERIQKEKLNIQEMRKLTFESQKKEEEVKMREIVKQIEEKEL